MADQLDTTREGVSEQPPVAEQQPEDQPQQQPEGEPQPQRPRTKHEEVMEAARANRRAQLEEETGAKFSSEADPDADVLELPPEEGAEPQPQAAQQPPVTPQPAAAAPQTVRVKVDGQEIDVPLDDLVKSYGLDRSSHQRFQAAANLLQQAQQLRQGGQPQPQPNSPAQAIAPAGAVPPEQPAPATLIEDAARVIEATQYGSKEDAAKQLADLIGKALQGRQTATPEEMAQQVAQRVAPQVLQTVEYNEALRQIGTEATDVLQHNMLAQTAGNLARQIRARDVQQGTIRPWIEVFRESISTVRSEVQKFAPGFAAPAQPQPQPPPTPTGTGAPTTQAQRLANKEALTPTPSAASARATVGTPPPQPKTPSQIVADMQRARGR